VAVSDQFADLMAKLDQSMVIVTTLAGDDHAGCLVGFHSQSSIDPPRYVVWISQANHTHEVAQRASVFAVHLVPSDRRDLAELFGGVTSDELDKLERCAWSPGPDGVPLLNGCPDRFVGRRVEWLDADGDHGGIVLEPTVVHTDGEGPWLRLADVVDIDAGHAPDD
jgi:flavin reductase (DIM6/NTAB) family NADH-FMN oxidoreductase RutF